MKWNVFLLTCDPVIPMLGVHPQEIQVVHKDVYRNVHSSSVHDSSEPQNSADVHQQVNAQTGQTLAIWWNIAQQQETANSWQMPKHAWISKHVVWETPDTKEHISHDTTYAQSYEEYWEFYISWLSWNVIYLDYYVNHRASDRTLNTFVN